jgi:hypothetical protein
MMHLNHFLCCVLKLYSYIHSSCDVCNLKFNALCFYQVAFNEAVAEVSCEPIKKHVQEGIGNTNRKPPKRSKRKQVIITTGLFV